MILADEDPVSNAAMRNGVRIFGGDGLRWSMGIGASGDLRADADGVVRRMEWGAGLPTLAVAATGFARGAAGRSRSSCPAARR